jgi:hypothetical protein
MLCSPFITRPFSLTVAGQKLNNEAERRVRFDSKLGVQSTTVDARYLKKIDSKFNECRRA